MLPKVAAALSLGAAPVAAAGGAGDWYPYKADNWAHNVGDDANMICKDGNEQSPIDFPLCLTPIIRSAPRITWKTQQSRLENNGHTVQLTPQNGDGKTGNMSYDIAGIDKNYELLQCHFHFGSEHFVGGGQQTFEAHCVHALKDAEATTQRYGVFGVFFDIRFNVESPFFKQFEDDLITHPDSVDKRRLAEQGVSFDLMGNPMDPMTKRRLSTCPTGVECASSMPTIDYTKLYSGVDLRFFWNYEGSFTTPPCTEAVDFYIYQRKAEMTSAQLNKMKTAIGWQTAASSSNIYAKNDGNFRPPQPMKTRTIYGCDKDMPLLENKDWYPHKASTWATSVGSNSHKVCDGGAQQSPIDFASCLEAQEQQAIQISWTSQKLKLSNNGHTIVLEVNKATSGTMTTHGKEYQLLQCHFHWGSEHTVADVQFPFETHCVHQQNLLSTEAPHYGVFGMFYKVTNSPNAFLAEFDGDLPSSSRRLRGEEQRNWTAPAKLNVFGEPMERRLAAGGSVSSYEGPLNFKKLYGNNPRTKFWSYGGSFTTPPCTEAVDFYIMMEPAETTAAQLTKFKSAIGWSAAGGNFRPPQKLGARVVTGCAKLVTVENILADATEIKYSAALERSIRHSVRLQVNRVLKDEQGSHTGMMIALVVLGATTVGIFAILMGMLIEATKGAPKYAEGGDISTIGNES